MRSGFRRTVVVGLVVAMVGLSACSYHVGSMGSEGSAGSSEAAGSSQSTDAVYDLYRPYGDNYCHLGDTVTFSAEVIDYDSSPVIGDEGLPEDGTEVKAADVDLSQFKFQWFTCHHVEDTGELVYIPIEGADSLSYTIDRVTKANLYDGNGELEYLLAMFPADEADLSYGNRINISSVWFCVSTVPDEAVANGQSVSCVSDPEGEASENDFVSFTTPEDAEYTVSVDNVSDDDATVGVYIAGLHDGVVVSEDEMDVDGSFTYKFEADKTYVLSWYTDSDSSVSFDYKVSGPDLKEPTSVDVIPEGSDAGLNAYVHQVTIRPDGEYQITVENPFVDADYSSSDEDVATVSDDGKIWAKGSGKATVTVTQGDETWDIAVTVK